MGSSSKQGFGWVRVPNWVLAGFKSQPRGFKFQAGFWLGSSPSHEFESQTGFWLGSITVHGFKSQSEVNGFTFKIVSLSLFSLDYCDIFRFGGRGLFYGYSSVCGFILKYSKV